MLSVLFAGQATFERLYAFQQAVGAQDYPGCTEVSRSGTGVGESLVCAFSKERIELQIPVAWECHHGA